MRSRRAALTSCAPLLASNTARFAQRTWLFDLDNTLHNASAHIFPHIGRAMRDYIRRHLQLDETEATQLRQHYWQRYGATLLGLIRHHDIDPRHFHPEAAGLAWRRTLDFLKATLS